MCFLIACVRLRPFQFWGVFASDLIFGCIRMLMRVGLNPTGIENMYDT